jgi:uncharacterized membrane protein
MGEKKMRKNKMMLLTVLLIIFIISVNVINAFALDDGVSPSSVHIHTFKKVVDFTSYDVSSFDDHYVYRSGYQHCTTCYHSEPFDERTEEPHNLVVKTKYHENSHHVYEKVCTKCKVDIIFLIPCDIWFPH